MNRQLVVVLLLVAVTLAAFWQALGCGFVNYDDDVYVLTNKHVQAGLTSREIRWAFTASYQATWQPLVWMSYMTDYQFYGLRPRGYHLTNLLFHLAAVLLLFAVLNRMTKRAWASGFVAALFAIHPLHVESVVWVAERKDTLSTCLWMLTMLAYVHYAEHPSTRRYALVVLCFALGLMAKPMLVTLPIVLLLVDYWPLARLRAEAGSKAGTSAAWRKLILEKVPLLFLTAASSVVTFVVQRQAGAVAPVQMLSFGVRAANMVVAYIMYVQKMIWPRNLSVFYPHPLGTLPTWQVLLSGVLLASLSVLAVLAARRRPYILMGWLWFVITLVPVIGLVQIGSHAVADRFTYIPLIGLFIIIAWSGSDLLAARGKAASPSRGARPLLPALAVLVVFALALQTRSQVRYWRDNITLFGHALSVTSNNALAHNNLGLALAAQGKLSEAVEHLSEAVRILPRSADARSNLGFLLAGQGRIDEAIEQYTESVRLDPTRADAQNGLGLVLAAKGRLDQAMQHFAAALRLDPENVEVLTNLARGRAAQGKTAEAVSHYRHALRLSPNNTVAANDLAWILASSPDPRFRNGAEAVRLARLACRQTGFSDPKMLDTLAAAWAEVGEFRQAESAARRALELAPAQHSGFASQVRIRLRLYQANRPFRERESGSKATSDQ